MRAFVQRAITEIRPATAISEASTGTAGYLIIRAGARPELCRRACEAEAREAEKDLDIVGGSGKDTSAFVLVFLEIFAQNPAAVIDIAEVARAMRRSGSGYDSAFIKQAIDYLTDTMRKCIEHVRGL